MNTRTASRAVHLGLLVFALLAVVSGLGITEYRTVSALTFGLLNKASANRLHLWAWIPFLVLLVAHVLLVLRPRWFGRRG